MRSKILPALVVMLLFGCATRKPSLTPSVEIKTVDSSQLRDVFMKDLLGRYPQYFDSLLKGNEKWHIRIIYTQVDRKANNFPVLTDHFFNITDAQYFYPASTVKMPVAFLSLQKLNELNIPGLDKNTTMVTESAYPGQTSVY